MEAAISARAVGQRGDRKKVVAIRGRNIAQVILNAWGPAK